ncbi:MAG: Ig-like domain-containing protein [Eubacterium sp.]|nr:Ig-like domain-containing protein [Eubacterium sp.]
MRKRIRIGLLLLLICAAGSVIDADNISDAKKKKPAISVKKLELGVTRAKKLTLKNVTKKQLKKVKWSSSDKTVATVSSNGKVFAVKSGRVNIKAAFKGRKYTCKVSVIQKSNGWAYMLDTGADSYKNGNIFWYYDDSYFTKDASVYQKKTAITSVLLSWASGPDKSVSVSDQSNRLKKLLTCIGFADFATNDDYKKAPGKDTFGVAFAKKQIGAGDAASTLIVVVPRSSGYEMEWCSNFDLGESGDHNGLDDAANKFLSGLNKYMTDKNIKGNIKLWFAGHSRGATADNLAEIKLATGKVTLPEGVVLKNEDIYGYNISCLKASAKPSDDTATGSYPFIHNVRLSHDFFTGLMPDQYGFIRYGTEHIIKSDDTVKDKALKKLKKYNNDLYNSYFYNDPDQYADNMTKTILDTLLYMYPDRQSYMDGMYPQMMDILNKTDTFGPGILTNVLSSDFIVDVLEAFYTSRGKSVPEDLFTVKEENGTTTKSLNLNSSAISELVAEFIHFPAIYVQHYTEVIYAFISA